MAVETAEIIDRTYSEQTSKSQALFLPCKARNKLELPLTGNCANASGDMRDLTSKDILAAAKRARLGKIHRLREAIAVGVADHERGDFVEINSRSELRKLTQQLGRSAKKAAKPSR
jgi:molybdopterin-guanine dinucleotide biosynthesis protein A